MYKCIKCQWLGYELIFLKGQGMCPVCKIEFVGCEKFIVLKKGKIRYKKI